MTANIPVIQPNDLGNGFAFYPQQKKIFFNGHVTNHNKQGASVGFDNVPGTSSSKFLFSKTFSSGTYGHGSVSLFPDLRAQIAAGTENIAIGNTFPASRSVMIFSPRSSAQDFSGEDFTVNGPFTMLPDGSYKATLTAEQYNQVVEAVRKTSGVAHKSSLKYPVMVAQKNDFQFTWGVIKGNELFVPVDKETKVWLTNGIRESVIIGANPERFRSNTVNIGSKYTITGNIPGEFLSDNFLVKSDQRLKTNIKEIHTKANGIKVYSFDFIANGVSSGGWIAQQVKELLEERGFAQEIIDLAIRKNDGTDWAQTVADFNAEVARYNDAHGTDFGAITYAIESRDLCERIKHHYKNSLGVREEYDEFIEIVRNLENPTDWQRETLQLLQNFKLQSIDAFEIHIEDLLTIDKNFVNDLLG